ncbi:MULTISPECIES: type IA DNA topoisomerase [Sphingobacterium]|uniref:type IA DNA topoisomerase n=1 Tax=Sphingobacterium TaxID=28453 RepID=UPI00257FD1C6|nr:MULTISPECIES: type IA DNA topoisomerase [Sphingobacterium]
MITVLAEKPSVAKEIAVILNAKTKDNGFYSGNGYFVTWALGHLVGLRMPEEYGISGYKRENLPIIPDPFLLTIRKVKVEKGYKVDGSALKQIKTISDLFDKSEKIIVATDAGREGELIFRYIYQYLNCNKPFERLWISSLTDKAIRNGFENLKDGAQFDGLYNAAKGRSRADWLVGINASQALTIAGGNEVYSLGRVQTPTLALICKRYEDHINFKVSKYWQIELEHKKEFISFKSLSIQKWDDKKIAEGVLRNIEKSGKVSIESVETKRKNEQAPLLFDLTGLQKEANKKLGFSADETQNIAQSLYEKKFITYPRTGSKYIPEDLWSEVTVIVRTLDSVDQFKPMTSKLKWGRFNKRIINDLKVSDHHGLLPTDRIPTALSAKENAIYEMIAVRLLESLSSSCIKEITEINLHALHYEFSLKGTVVIEPGWREIKGLVYDENEEAQELPVLQKGDEFKIIKSEILEKTTQAPNLFTEAGLLSAMENAGKQIKNLEEKKALQGIGIGTPATRASIIETLFSRNYIKMDKKALIPTDKGFKVYNLVKDMKISDVQMTAEWEMALQKVENNEADLESFLNSIKDFTSTITMELLELTIDIESVPKITCPKCQSHYLEIKDKMVKCLSENCNWIQFRYVCGKQLSLKDIEMLVINGKTSLIKGFKSKADKRFDAFIVLNPDGKTAFEFEKKFKKK